MCQQSWFFKIHSLVAISSWAIPFKLNSGWVMGCYSFSICELSHLGRSFSLLFYIERHSFCSMAEVCLLNLNEEECTGRTWWAVETGRPIKVMIFFGGFGVDSKVFLRSLIALDNIVVMIFPGAIIHVFDTGQHLFFHWYSIIRRYIYDYNSHLFIIYAISVLHSLLLCFFGFLEVVYFWF